MAGLIALEGDVGDEGQKETRKSNSANFAAHRINFYSWNGRAAPQVAFCQGEIPLANLVFESGINLGCVPLLVLLFLYCRGNK